VFTGKQLAEYCEKVYKAGWVYWYGTYGKRCTQSLYESKKKQYPSHYGSSRTSGYMRDIAEGRTCADCVGMIKAFFWSGGEFGAEPKYGTNHCPDKSANGMIAICSQTGPISTIPDEPGLVVWKDGHIGVYVGGGYTVEMKGFDYDCKRNKVKSGPWTKWGRLPASMITYDETPEPTPEPEPVGLRRGDHGSAVTKMQQALLKWDAGCLPRYGADGDFGSETEKAVKAFQAAAGLPVTGVCDEATRAALLAWPDEEPLILYVGITGGSVNVRSAPDINAGILGVVYKGNVLPYGGLSKTADGREWHLVEFALQNGWVSGKYSRLLKEGEQHVSGDDADSAADAGAAVGAGPEPVKRGTKICDISKYQADVDYDKFIGDTALIILRAGYRKSDGVVHEDERFQRHSDALTERGVRFGVYFYSIATNEDKAREEARMFWKYAKDYSPLFWAGDFEKDSITTGAIVAFIDELRRLGAKKVGCYCANHLYNKYDYSSIRDQMDFTWIPRYGSTKPVHKCDLWQYTSTGSVDGIAGDVDLSKITGDGHDLNWFTAGGESVE